VRLSRFEPARMNGVAVPSIGPVLVPFPPRVDNQGPASSPSGFFSFNSFIVVLYSPVHLLVTDPQGRQSGFNVAAGKYLHDIPNTTYYDHAAADVDDPDPATSDPDPTKSFLASRPADGTYQLALTGVGNGAYAMDVMINDNSRNLAGKLTLAQIPVSVGERQSYALTYSAASPGPPALSGGFDGGGQRPRDVNQFLTYARPSASRNTLSAGTTAYVVVVKYGATIKPETFAAVLNGTDVGASFHPAPSTFESVPVPVRSGNNVLRLSVDGTSGTRTATDTDRLELIVP